MKCSEKNNLEQTSWRLVSSDLELIFIKSRAVCDVVVYYIASNSRIQAVATDKFKQMWTPEKNEIKFNKQEILIDHETSGYHNYCEICFRIAKNICARTLISLDENYASGF